MDEPAIKHLIDASETLSALPPDVAHDLLGAARARMLRAGDELFTAGEPADGLAVVERGRLGILATDTSSTDTSSTDTSRTDTSRVVATLGRGEVVGEMGALAGAARSTTVIALRDTAVLELDQRRFDKAFDSSPAFARSLSRLVVTRLTGPPDDARRSIPTTVAVVQAGPGEPEPLVKALDAVAGSSVVVDRSLARGRSGPALLEALENHERDSELVVMLAGRADQPDDWLDLCLRQADAVIVHVAGDTPADARWDALAARLRALHCTVELAIVNPRAAVVGIDAARWITRLAPDRYHHLADGDPGTLDRAARLVLGRGIGLVFSGGAAKGLAHLGAWRAITEAGIPVDTVGGVSFGALMGAGVAVDYSPEQLRREVETRLIHERGLVDLTFPWTALLRGRGVSRRLEEVGHGWNFEQTWRRFVCTSCDLTSGSIIEHRAGPIWRAVRASVSIPGVLPPVRWDDHLLVDGAVRNNLPIAAVRNLHPTPLRILAIDVGKDSTLAPGELPPVGHVSGWRLVRHRLNPRRPSPGVPSMAQVLMRVMELAGDDLEPGEADLMVRPDLTGLSLGDFEQIDRYEEAGYRATAEALADGF